MENLKEGDSAQANGQKPEEEIIFIENPEVVEGNVYTGTIVSVHEGFIFIGSVKRAYETVNTRGDVFCPVPKDIDYTAGAMVQFYELNPDQERPGKMRTENISVIDTSVALSAANERAVAIQRLSNETSPYHQLKKLIEASEIEKAGEQKPLAQFIESITWMLNHEQGFNPEKLTEMTENFVINTFPMLIPIGVQYSIKDDIDEEVELTIVNQTIEDYKDNGLQGQADSLRKEYDQFVRVRKVFTLMLSANLLRCDTIMNIENLPEMTYAFPVWYVCRKNGLSDRTGQDDPEPDAAVKFFSNCVGSKEYSWFYQMYNRRTRPLSQFSGKDIMPPSIMKVMKQAKEIFDYVVIMTPYHDKASREWSDPNWLRNIDPIMIGFLEGLPQMFVLGRWSGTGVFPLMLDCIADTSNHLRLNKHLLANFSHNSWWHMGNINDGKVLSANNDNVLEKFADRLLSAYDNGKLFEFLRGELSTDPNYSF